MKRTGLPLPSTGRKEAKAQLKTEIEGLEGIGEKTALKLLKHFKSLKKIREASFEEIEKLVGRAKAQILKE